MLQSSTDSLTANETNLTILSCYSVRYLLFLASFGCWKDVSQFENGIGPLKFESLRIISFPGGQQYGAISPCEMNEFSDECEAWEAENGPYQRGDYMIKSNPRTKGR